MKTPNAIDAHIGQRIRMRRTELGMSQEKLGDAVELTFQQIQKYEKGTNRVGGSRMHQIAGALKCDPAYFYVGLTAGPKAADPVQALLATKHGMRLFTAYTRITSPAVQQRLVRLAEAIAGEEEDDS